MCHDIRFKIRWHPHPPCHICAHSHFANIAFGFGRILKMIFFFAMPSTFSCPASFSTIKKGFCMETILPSSICWLYSYGHLQLYYRISITYLAYYHGNIRSLKEWKREANLNQSLCHFTLISKISPNSTPGAMSPRNSPWNSSRHHSAPEVDPGTDISISMIPFAGLLSKTNLKLEFEENMFMLSH